MRPETPVGPTPERLTYVVGDIHGAWTLLEPLLARIEADRGTQPANLVIIGDMIDRGPDSAAVLRHLHGLEAVCLRGNHEQMALDFLDAPRAAGPRWLRNGGTETLHSFGIGNVHATRLDDLADAFRSALGDLEPWLRGLPMLWQSGDLVCAHAGMDPRRAPHRQKPEALLWGRSPFLDLARTDDLWVAYGHWPATAPTCADGRISVDTGAGRGGMLTAARMKAGEPVRYLSDIS